MGKVLLVGYPHKPVAADFSLMGSRNIHIFSIRGEGWANCSRAVSMLAQNRISLKPLATHSFPLDQIEEAFKTFVERIGGAVKVIVQPNA
jgi:L-iditol 2-dehydrogenase